MLANAVKTAKLHFMRHVSFTNGLELLVHNDIRLKNTVLNLLYKVGSAQEDKTQTGLAHFLEHIMFEGSANFPNFDAELQAMMAENNAFTGQDYTCYYEIFPHRFFKRVLQIEKDRMYHLAIKTKSVHLQSSVIQEEFKETSLHPPLADVWHHLQKLCFKNAYQWPVIGKNLAHIASIDKKVLMRFYKNHYQPSNTILSIITALDEEVIVKEVELVFQTKRQASTFTPAEIEMSGKDKVTGTKRLIRSNVATPHFYLAFHMDDYASRSYFLSDMVSDLLTNGESSLLYKALVSESKLCTEVTSYTTDNIHCNLLIIEGKLTSGIDFEGVYHVLENVFKHVLENGITKSRFETLHNKALSYWSFYHYNTAHLAQNMAIFYQARSVLDIHKYIAEIYDSIEKKDLENHIANFLRLDKTSRLEYMPK